ncbi:uncharacterized protein J8A68_002623 [[Candida] subhashii]|uniref:Derlin n=1 Tax=[Candida] subhashii TaxID=561895 RepID=A0A8J5V0H3_9ASCO|nr:uncharacterized protein J8A68_002623 [[Candida] subhashii]KAG7663874.1 hypothetical protein J8A68_002623 [[Candida] subhashii]
MSSNPILASIKRIPPVTRFFTIGSVLACIGISTFNGFDKLFINYPILSYLILVTKYSFQNDKTYLAKSMTLFTGLIQFYKFFSSFIIPSGILSKDISTLLNIYFFYTFSNHLEIGKFGGIFPDYVWFILLNGIMIQIVRLGLECLSPTIASMITYPHEMLLACLTYIWSRQNKNATINLMGLIPIKAYYLPLGNIIVNGIVGGPIAVTGSLIGIMSGYLYLCLQSQTTPIYNLFPGAYGTPMNRTASGRRVGATSIDRPGTRTPIEAEFIGDSIYDSGYLRAPTWLYNFLNYPRVRPNNGTVPLVNRTGNMSRMQQQQATADSVSSGNSWFSGNKADGESPVFRGKGQRLGG